MNFSLQHLKVGHFPLLLKWLNSEHIQQFWDQGTLWTAELIQEKYNSYANGYKIVNEKKLPIVAFIIHLENTPIGYIQAYNAFDYQRDGYDLEAVVKDISNLGAMDIFLGEAHYLGKGMASPIIKKFLNDYVWHNFDHCLVDPDSTNHRAIRAYEKAGFVKIGEAAGGEVSIMIATKLSSFAL